jgi:poly-gamma-glutamate system protein
MRNIPKIDSGKNNQTIFMLFTLSLIIFLIFKTLPFGKEKIIYKNMVKASKIMLNAMQIIKRCQREKGVFLNKEIDKNQTGLIGVKFSPLTTSIGNLEAKRTTTNPNFSALIVFLLKEAGVKRGDTIAVGASSSFPALILAVLSAGKALNLKILMICSLGASQWGANNPDFDLLDILDCLLKERIFNIKPVAITIGGEKDIGLNINPEVRDFIVNKIKKRGIYFIYEPNLRKNVKIRMNLYKKNAEKNRIKAFINIGGNWVNMGEDTEVLKLKPGIVRINKFPSIEKRGVIHEMALNKIPVIHLLYIKGLVEKYGLLWDPVPLPKPGQGGIYQIIKIKQPSFLIITAIYLLSIFLILIFRNKLNLIKIK